MKTCPILSDRSFLCLRLTNDGNICNNNNVTSDTNLKRANSSKNYAIKRIVESGYYVSVKSIQAVVYIIFNFIISRHETMFNQLTTK